MCVAFVSLLLGKPVVSVPSYKATCQERLAVNIFIKRLLVELIFAIISTNLIEGYSIVARRKREEPTQAQQQIYDNLLKSLFEGREKEILPYFLPGSQYVETLDIEAHRTTLRLDRVYKAIVKERPHIIDIEFETGSDPDMAARLLDYHAYLYRKYKLPVISIIVYPFRTTMATSPLREVSGEEDLLIFHFRMLPLWKQKAERYLNEHAVSMYSLLPTMEGADTHVLAKAIDEMIEYYKDDQIQLAQELRWMGIVLRRADTVPLEEKRVIEERLTMYDELFEQDPKMRKIRAESEAKGRAEGLQFALVTVVEERFPPLTALAKETVPHISKPNTLQLLLKGIAAAPDEASARLLLELLAA